MQIFRVDTWLKEIVESYDNLNMVWDIDLSLGWYERDKIKFDKVKLLEALRLGKKIRVTIETIDDA